MTPELPVAPYLVVVNKRCGPSNYVSSDHASSAWSRERAPTS
jgi:hypothetical protein